MSKKKASGFSLLLYRVFGGSEVITGMNYTSVIACPFLRELLIEQTLANLAHHCMEAIPR